jgi:hypothetical protein
MESCVFKPEHFGVHCIDTRCYPPWQLGEVSPISEIESKIFGLIEVRAGDVSLARNQYWRRSSGCEGSLKEIVSSLLRNKTRDRLVV